MNYGNKILLGALLTLIGLLGIILGPLFGFTSFEQPWSFITGFFTGLISGLGITLLITGFITRQNN